MQLMHSQTKAAAPVECLGIEPTMQRVLMATCTGSSRQPVITSHSLSLESGFLAEQPAYLLRPLRPAGAPAFQRATQVLTNSIQTGGAAVGLTAGVSGQRDQAVIRSLQCLQSKRSRNSAPDMNVP